MGCLARAILNMARKSVFSIIGLVRKFLFLIFLVSFSLTQMYGSFVIGLVVIILALLPLFGANIRVSTSDISPYFFGGFLIIGIYGLCLGSYLGVDYSVIFESSKVFIFYPIVGFLVALLVKHFCSLKFIRNVVFTATGMLVIINCMAVFEYYFGAGFLPSAFIESGMLTFSFYDGRFILNALNIASIPLLFAFLLFYTFFDKRTYSDVNRGKKNHLISYALLILLVLVIIGSGRRGIWMTSVLSIFFIYMMCGRSMSFGKAVLQVFAMSGLMLGILFYFDVFSFYGSEFQIQSERSIQSEVLIEAFYDSPLGHGIGSSFAVVRSEKGWIYELTWHKLLADVGVLLPLMIFFFFGLLIKILRANKSLVSHMDYDLCLLAIISAGAIVLASATNPYILNLDGLIGLGFVFGVFDGVRSRSIIVSSVSRSQEALI